MAAKFICIVDESKLTKGALLSYYCSTVLHDTLKPPPYHTLKHTPNTGLGPGFPLPVEITPFCHEHTLRVVQGTNRR